MPTRLRSGTVVHLRPHDGKGGDAVPFLVSGAEKDRVLATQAGGPPAVKGFFPRDRVVVILEEEDHNLFYEATIVEVRLPDTLAFRVHGTSKRISKREYLRITDFLCLEYAIRRGQERELLDAFRKRSNRKVPTRLTAGTFFTRQDDRSEFAEVEKEILKVLVGMDTKIDAIVRFLGSGDRKALSIFTPRWVDLGGSGIRLNVSEPVSPTDFIELRIQLPDFEGAPVPAFCKVIRVSPSTRKDEPGTEVALHYLHIEEEDRDRIIRYLFARQRDAIRSGAERREEVRGVE
jgi:hypothetical protein